VVPLASRTSEFFVGVGDSGPAHWPIEAPSVGHDRAVLSVTCDDDVKPNIASPLIGCITPTMLPIGDEIKLDPLDAAQG
jgi:hypothetical protein